MLASVLAHKDTVKRVVITSSVAGKVLSCTLLQPLVWPAAITVGDSERLQTTAVHGEYAAPPVSGSLYTDQDWNQTSSIENGQAYHLSKVPCW